MISATNTTTLEPSLYLILLGKIWKTICETICSGCLTTIEILATSLTQRCLILIMTSRRYYMVHSGEISLPVCLDQVLIKRPNMNAGLGSYRSQARGHFEPWRDGHCFLIAARRQ